MSETAAEPAGATNDLPLPGDEPATETAPEPKIKEESAEIPQESPVNSDSEENSSEDEELPLPETDEDDRKTWPKGYADRLKREKTKLAEERARSAELAARLESVAQPVIAPPMHPQHFENPPDRDDFVSDVDYQEALLDHVMNKKMAKAQVVQQQAAMDHHEKEFTKKWVDVHEKGPEKYSDFDEKVAKLSTNEFPPNRAMCEAILDSKHSADILYFLGMYPNKAKEIALLNPVQAVRRVTEIEHRFAARKKTTSVKTIDPVGASGGRSNKGAVLTGNKAPDNMQDFRKWYESKTGKKK